MCKAKLSSATYLINSVKKYLTNEHLKILYYSLVYPYLDYGIMLWGSAAITLRKPLITTQKKVIRVISNSSYNAHTTPLFKRNNILPIDDLYELQLAKFMFKYSRNELPTKLMQNFELNKDVHNHNTRHKNDPHIKHYNTRIFATTFLHIAPNLWLDIKQSIKNCNTCESFNRQYKKLLLNKY